MRKTSRWPFSQNDPQWAKELMWDREQVIAAHIRATGESRRKAEDLLHAYEGGNTIAADGCMLTCAAMILRLLGPESAHWDPKRLNVFAKREKFYSESGISMVPFYSDLVSDASKGNVQLCTKEEYLSGKAGWPRNFCNTSLLVRAYRRLSSADRQHFVIMLKTGTYDDSFASHYLLIDPDQPGEVDCDNPMVLDPARPMEHAPAPWTLHASEQHLLKDRAIKAARKETAIQPKQIGGVWLFARWRSRHDPLLLGPMAATLAAEYAAR